MERKTDKMKKHDEINILIPVYMEDFDTDVRSVADNIMFQHSHYGFSRFMLTLPGKGWRSVSYPPREYFEERAGVFKQIKALLAPEISFGWWHTLTLKSGPTPGYTRIVRQNGTEAPFSTCPLDPGYRKRFAGDVAFFLDKARPDFFITEDDFGINCHGGPGCFCEHHLAEFARREGRSYSREELEYLFTEKKDESRELLRRWQTLAKDSLVLFAQAVRAEADKLTPEIPMGCMETGVSAKDGNSAEAIARAFAGNKHTPFVRFHGTFYAGEQIKNLPGTLFSSLYSKEHIKGEFTFIHECDTYPHTRFYTSAGCMRAMMGAVFSFGFDGAVFQNQQMLDDHDEEKVYSLMYHRERSRFNAIRKSVEGCQMQGVRLLNDPFERGNFPCQQAEWLKVVSAFGIPYTTREDEDIVLVSGEQLRFLSDEKIMELLAKNLFLDGDAARVLTERNFAHFTGARVEEGLLQGKERFDLGAKEIICGSFCPEHKGRTMTRADAYSPKGNGLLYKVEIAEPGCEEVTKIVDFRGEYTAPGMTFFRNALGGKVVICAAALENHHASSLFNYRRQALLQDLLIRCNAQFPMVKKAPHLFFIANKPVEKKDFKAFLTCINLAVDPLEELSLYLPENLRKCSRLRFLDQDGSWQDLPFERTADGITVNMRFDHTVPVCITLA